MDTLLGNALVDEFKVRLPYETEDMYRGFAGHGALAALNSFNEHMASRPLSRVELRLFLASMAAFNRHTIGGIAILAGRISDEVLPLMKRTGHEIGAHVLGAAIDEYGLRESVTHVELAREFAEHLGIPADQVEATDNACPVSVTLGNALFDWYRNSPTAFALGVHTASEVTSLNEFAPWHDVFLKFPEYRFVRDQPEFEYMRAHTTHEPEHISGVKTCVARYLGVLPANGLLLRQGAVAYLDLYQQMFHELDALIFR